MGAVAPKMAARCERSGLVPGCSACDAFPTSPTEAFDCAETPSKALVNLRLLMGARDGDLSEVSAAIEQGAYLETRKPIRFRLPPSEVDLEQGGTSERMRIPQRHGREGMTPLMHAAQAGSVEVCEALLMAGACVHAKDEDGMTPLHFAATVGADEVCRLLVSWGADAQIADDEDRLAVDLVPVDILPTIMERKRWSTLLSTPTEKPLAPRTLARAFGASPLE